MQGIPLRSVARSFGLTHMGLWRWCSAGLVSTAFHPGGRGRGDILLDDAGIAEAATVKRLRAAGVSLQKIRAAVAELRRRGIQGARWLCLDARGRVVVLNARDRVEDVLTGQTFFVFDLNAVRGDVDRVRRQFGKAVVKAGG